MMDRIRAFSRSPTFWLIGTCLLLAHPFHDWLRISAPLGIPQTPVDNVNFLYAEQWLLLTEAARVIPEGHSYTAIARDRETEMLLFILSLGALPGREPLPTSYWRATRGSEADRAEYVVSFECVEPPGRNRLRLRFATGCVFDRGVDPP